MKNLCYLGLVVALNALIVGCASGPKAEEEGAGGCSGISFSAQPNDATAGTVMQPVVVQLSPVTSAANRVTISLVPSAALGGTLSVDAVAGVATFSTLKPTKAGEYQLQVRSSTGAVCTSQPFTVYSAAPSKVVITQYPITRTPTDPKQVNNKENEPLTPALVVEVQDAYGNLIKSRAQRVNISLKSPSNVSGAKLSGVTSQETSEGTATFRDLRINKQSDGQHYHLVVEVEGINKTAQSPGFAVGGSLNPNGPGSGD